MSRPPDTLANPEPLQHRRPFGASHTPAPTSVSCCACSYTWTSIPARASATAAAIPPIPPPTTTARRATSFPSPNGPHPRSTLTPRPFAGRSDSPVGDRVPRSVPQRFPATSSRCPRTRTVLILRSAAAVVPCCRWPGPRTCRTAGIRAESTRQRQQRRVGCHGSGIISPVPVLSTSTSSVSDSQPDATSCRTAAKHAAPSGQMMLPSSRATAR